MHVMVDLETQGVRPTSIIMSIGAVVLWIVIAAIVYVVLYG